MILVTGGTGLVGSRLLYDLAKKEKKVRALKRANSSLDIFNNWIKEEPKLSQYIEWVDGDLLDLFSLEEALIDITIIYHCAATISFVPSESKLMEQTNIEGTANLINLCLEKNAFKCFCHVSSVASLGRVSENILIDETNEWIPGKHNSSYGISKYGAEREVWRGIAEGLNAVIVNPSIIVGPGNWNKGSSEIFLRIKNGFKFYTDGTSGFVDVVDVCSAMQFLVERNILGERYILNSKNISFKDLFILIANELHTNPPFIHVQPWVSAIVWRLEKLRSKITGKKPFITKETAHSGHQLYSYNAHKIEALGFKFIPLNQTIKTTCAELVKSYP